MTKMHSGVETHIWTQISVLWTSVALCTAHPHSVCVEQRPQFVTQKMGYTPVSDFMLTKFTLRYELPKKNQCADFILYLNVYEYFSQTDLLSH